LIPPFLPPSLEERITTSQWYCGPRAVVQWIHCTYSTRTVHV
jgi:hypothetical protein